MHNVNTFYENKLINVFFMIFCNNKLVNPKTPADGEDEYVGCPHEIFALTSLRRLNLSFHGLRQLPQHIQQLTMLEELIISNSPLLESLPGELTLLPHLRGLFVR